jgi:nucleoid DNA-binding protein
MNDIHKKRIVDASVDALLSSSFKDNISSEQVDIITSLKTNEFEFIIDQIRKSVNTTVINGLKDKENITLPRLGTFKYKRGKELSYNVMREICASYGFENVRSISDPILKAKVKKEVNDAANKVRLNNYFLEHKGRSNKVLGGFKHENNNIL